PEEPLVIPAPCLVAMTAPAAEPACRLVFSSSATFLVSRLPLALPLHQLEPSAPHIPQVGSTRTIAAAEPVMSGVHPRTAAILVSPISIAALLSIPEIPGFTQEVFGFGRPVQGLAAEPAESFVAAAETAVPANRVAQFRVPDAAALLPA